MMGRRRPRDGLLQVKIRIDADRPGTETVYLVPSERPGTTVRRRFQESYVLGKELLMSFIGMIIDACTRFAQQTLDRITRADFAHPNSDATQG